MFDFLIRRVRRLLVGPVEAGMTGLAAQIGRANSLVVRGKLQVESLRDVEFGVSSQWGEDGILDWLVERLGPAATSFVEFGVEDYAESNTRFLLENRNWRGLVLDADAHDIRTIRNSRAHWRHDLQAVCAFIDRDNINRLIEGAGLSGEIGLLSIDIDGNDYWVWEAISVVKPVLVVCEYNAVFGDLLPLSVPYRADFRRSEAHFSNLYAGVSIAALIELGTRKGYELAGSNSAGTNAFFVRQDHAELMRSCVRDRRPMPSRLRESRDPQGNLTYIRGAARQAAIADLPLVNVLTGETRPLSKWGALYSERWASIIG